MTNLKSLLAKVQFLCDQCDFKATGKRHLTQHINSIHGGVQCDICDYKTTLKSNLRRHFKLIHESVKLISCKLCDYKTSRSDSLKRHVKSVHVVGRFQCEMCDFKAKQRKSLNISHRKKFSFKFMQHLWMQSYSGRRTRKR